MAVPPITSWLLYGTVMYLLMLLMLMLLIINHSWAQELYSVPWAAMSITDTVFVQFVVILGNTKI